MNRFEAKNFDVKTCYCKENILDEDIYHILQKLPDEVAEKDINSLLENYKELSSFIVIWCPVCESCYEECDCNSSIYKVESEDNIYYYDNILPYEHFYDFNGVLFCNENCVIDFIEDMVPGVEDIEVLEFSPGHHKKCSFRITINGITEYYDLRYYKNLDDLKKEIEKGHNL